VLGISVIPVLVAVAGLMIMGRLVPSESRKAHNDVAGFIFAVLGVIYAVLLAFVVIVVWEEFERAETDVESEANELANVYFLADRFPEPEKTRIRDLARSYARTVVEEEWPLMARGRESPRADELLHEIRLTFLGLDPHTGTQQILYEQGLERIHELQDARTLRLVDARRGVPAVLWTVLVLGAVVTVGFTYLFGLESNLMHALMVAALTLVITSVLFTIAALNYPFSGVVRVPPDAFEAVLRAFDNP
jgi:Protein of unknown function (DUF4239)